MVTDTQGDAHIFRVPAYYIPEARQRLMSPQDYADFHGWDLTRGMGAYHGHQKDMWIQLALQDSNETRYLNASISKMDGIPYFEASVQNCEDPKPTCTCGNTCPSCNTAKLHDHLLEAVGYSMEVLSEANENLSAAQKDLLLDHQRLGHIGFDHLQSLYRDRELNCEFDGCSKTSGACLVSNHRSTATCDIPMCITCQASKAKQRATGATHSKRDPSREDILKADRLQPGEQVHVDHYQSSVRARLRWTRGREPAATQYQGGTIFHDAATGLIKCYHLSEFNTEQTLRCKRRFEADVAQCGITVQSYRTDNGRSFTSFEFEQELLSHNQDHTFSGAGAQHQNALAERSIQTVMNMARSMLLHVQVHWPDQYDTKLWAFALDYAVWLWNHTPRKDNGLAPIEIFCGIKTSCDYLRRAKVFGSPVYILDHKLREGKKLPKWEPRSHRGQFLGFSPLHSSSVGLIRNLNTGTITPQFHFIVDQKFTTVPGGQSGQTIPKLT